MKYSLRSLMIVVTLATIPCGLAARSHHCARYAAFHKTLVPYEENLKNGAWVFAFKKEHGTVFSSDPILSRYEDAWMDYHWEAAIAYERVSKMPWLPLSLPPSPTPMAPVDR